MKLFSLLSIPGIILAGLLAVSPANADDRDSRGGFIINPSTVPVSVGQSTVPYKVQFDGNTGAPLASYITITPAGRYFAVPPMQVGDSKTGSMTVPNSPYYVIGVKGFLEPGAGSGCQEIIQTPQGSWPAGTTLNVNFLFDFSAGLHCSITTASSDPGSDRDRR